MKGLRTLFFSAVAWAVYHWTNARISSYHTTTDGPSTGPPSEKEQAIRREKEYPSIKNMLRPMAGKKLMSDPAISLGLRERFPQPNIAVVFVDGQNQDFVRNSHMAFLEHSPQTQYLAIGMDPAAIEACRKVNIPTVAIHDLVENLTEHPIGKTSEIPGCPRIGALSELQEVGFNVLFLESDVAIASGFEMAYFSNMDADFISRKELFSQETDTTGGGEKSFGIQSGLHFIKTTEGAVDFLKSVASLCRGDVENNEQVALKEALSLRFRIHTSPLPKEDNFGTRVYTASSLHGNKDLRVGILREQFFPDGILGEQFFPDGFEIVEGADTHAKIHDPNVRVPFLSEERRSAIKKASLARAGAWHIEEMAPKAWLWSFPGSGTSMLRYTLEQITGKIGGTNSVCSDKRLTPLLPGEEFSNGFLIHVPSLKEVVADDEQVAVDKKREFALHSNAKHIHLIRNPYDAIWSWYNLVQTGSYSGRIKAKDFNPSHFARMALEWAELFDKSVRNGDPSTNTHGNDDMMLANNANRMLVKFEDLVQDQDLTLRHLLTFLDEDHAKEPSKTKLQIARHPFFQRNSEIFESTYVSKHTAYASPELIDQMWDVFKASAERLGYSKRRNRYLMYSPSGGLTNQLMELELGVRFAQKSGRTLLLPPLLAEDVKIFPNIWKDSQTTYRCTQETLTAEACQTNFNDVSTFLWDQVLDLSYISSRVSIMEAIPDNVMIGLSAFSLCGFHKCNTNWLQRDLRDQERCLPGFLPEFAPPSNDTVKQRSLDCVFRHTIDADILQFGSLFKTTGKQHIVPDVSFAKEIRFAANEIIQSIRQTSERRGRYLCAQLRLAGSEWEETSIYTLYRKSNLKHLKTFLDDKDAEGLYPLYIATDNEAFVLESTDVCSTRACLFASDFSNITNARGLKHFQQLVPIDYLTCSNADEVMVSVGSSLGFYIENLHNATKIEAAADGETKGQEQREQNLPEVLDVKDMKTISSTAAKATAQGKEQQLNLRTGRVAEDTRATTSTPEKKYAYAMLLGWNPDKKQRDTYRTAVLVLIRSLRETKTSADIVVMMMYKDPTTRSMMEEYDTIVFDIEALPTPSVAMNGFQPWFKDMVLGKLHVLELIQYDRIQFLDADIVLQEGSSLDNLFDYAPQTPLVTEGLGDDSPIRSGWFMVTPSIEMFVKIKATAERGVFDAASGWDLLGLSASYPGWREEDGDGAKAWIFYGAQLEQGLLFHHFYSLPKSKSPGIDDAVLLEIFDDNKMHSMGIFHCYGELKPWKSELDLDEMPQVFAESISRWRKLASNLNRQPEEKKIASVYVNPLVNAGEKWLQDTFSYTYPSYPSLTSKSKSKSKSKESKKKRRKKGKKSNKGRQLEKAHDNKQTTILRAKASKVSTKERHENMNMDTGRKQHTNILKQVNEEVNEDTVKQQESTENVVENTKRHIGHALTDPNRKMKPILALNSSLAEQDDCHTVDAALNSPGYQPLFSDKTSRAPSGTCKLMVVYAGSPCSGLTLNQKIGEQAIASLGLSSKVSYWRYQRHIKKTDSVTLESYLASLPEKREVVQVKSHEFDSEILRICDQNLVITVTRDPVEMLASYVGAGWVNIGECQRYFRALDKAEDKARCWMQHAKLHFNYKDMAENSAAASKAIASKVAELLGLDSSTIAGKEFQGEANPSIPSSHNEDFVGSLADPCTPMQLRSRYSLFTKPTTPALPKNDDSTENEFLRRVATKRGDSVIRSTHIENIEAKTARKDGSEASGLAVEKRSEVRSCAFRRYPPHRYYWRESTQGLPLFLENSTYVRGKLPVILDVGPAKKICIDQPWEKARFDGRLPFTDGFNPSVVPLSMTPNAPMSHPRLKSQHVAPLEGIFGASVVNTMFVAFTRLGGSQCSYRDDGEIKAKFNISTYERYGKEKAKFNEPSLAVFLDSNFEWMDQSEIMLELDADFGVEKAEGSRVGVAHKRESPSATNIYKYAHVRVRLDDAKAFLHKREIWISYYGPHYGFDNGNIVLNKLHFDMSPDDSSRVYAFIKASETSVVCCGRNIALISENGKLKGVSHVDPMTVESFSPHIPLTSKADKASLIHGTNGEMVFLPASSEYLGIAHFHRPKHIDVPCWENRNQETCKHAKFGHHYTHVFYTITASAPHKIKRLSNEFVFPVQVPDVRNNAEIIQFASGLSLADPAGDEVLISYGINDCESAIIRLPMKKVQSMLTALQPKTEVSDLMVKPTSVVSEGANIGNEPSTVADTKNTENARPPLKTTISDVPLALPLPTPIIVVGLPKSGTTSIKSYFDCGGYRKRTSHFNCLPHKQNDRVDERRNCVLPPGAGGPTDPIAHAPLCAVCVERNIMDGRPPLEGCGAYDIWTELDGAEHPRPVEGATIDEVQPLCSFPQVTHLDKIHAAYPNATFILNLRDANDWVRSISKWTGIQGELEHLEGYIHHALIKCALPDFPSGDPDLLSFYHAQTDRVRDFVRRHPSHTLVEVKIDAHDAGQVMESAFGIPESCWGKSNANDAAKTSPGQTPKKRKMMMETYPFCTNLGDLFPSAHTTTK